MQSNTSRRAFVTGLSAPLILGAGDKSGSARPVVGEGSHRYEVIHDWGELPANIKYGNTHGVVEDSQGNIYVHHTVNNASESHDTMVVFDGKGKFVRSWGKEFKGGAHGLHIAREGKQEFLYMCDTRRALVVKSTLLGEEVWSVGYPKEAKEYAPGPDGKNKRYSPTNLALAPNGDVYVGDGYGSNYINVYSKKGEYKFSFGGTGKEAGQLACPHGLMIDTRDKKPVVLVADRTNTRLQRFTLEGKHIDFQLTKPAEGSIAKTVHQPCHFSVFKNGDVVIPDLASRVTLLNKKNEVICHLGEDDPAGSRSLRTKPREQFVAGKFVCPHGACFDHEGNIFVVEWVEVGRVTKLRKVS